MSVTIRLIAASDQGQWQLLYAAYQAFYDRPDLPQSFFDDVFARLMRDDPLEFYGLVAVDGTSLLGLTHYVFHPNIRLPEGTCYLQDLFTVPDVRGKGVGRALIRAVYDAADARGVPSVYWLTQEFNYPGRMLYDKVAVKSPFIRYDRPA